MLGDAFTEGDSLAAAVVGAGREEDAGGFSGGGRGAASEVCCGFMDFRDWRFDGLDGFGRSSGRSWLRSAEQSGLEGADGKDWCWRLGRVGGSCVMIRCWKVNVREHTKSVRSKESYRVLHDTRAKRHIFWVCRPASLACWRRCFPLRATDLRFNVYFGCSASNRGVVSGDI